MKAARFLVLVALIVFPSSVFADSIVNGGFETGDLTGWTTAGDVAAIGSSFIGVTPAGGQYQAVLGADDTGALPPQPQPLVIYPPFSFVFSGHPGAGSVDLGVPFYGPPPNTFAPGTIGGLAFSIYGASLGVPGAILQNGSAMSQSFFGKAGSVLTFDFDYLTDDSLDLAVVTLDGSISLLGCCAAGGNPSSSLFHLESGYHTFSMVLPTTGIHQLGFGVFNTLDDQVPSALLIDNVALTSVPEPSTWLLLASGLAAFVLIRRWSPNDARS